LIAPFVNVPRYTLQDEIGDSIREYPVGLIYTEHQQVEQHQEAFLIIHHFYLLK